MSDKEQAAAVTHDKVVERSRQKRDRENPVGYFELLLSNSNFRWLWAGQVVSLLGDWFNIIASAILIHNLTESGLALGILFTIRMLAPFFVAPLAGICADRFNRKHILIITDIVRGLLLLGFLFVKDADDIWLLYLLTTLLFGVSGFFSPARSAILPDVTSQRELGTANALSATSWSVMLALGAAIGGFTAGLLGVHTAFIIDGLTFFVSAVLLLQIRLPRRSISTTEVREGSKFVTLRYMLRHPDILFISLHKAAIALLLSSGFQVAQVEIAKTHFVIGIDGAISLGLMYCMGGVGSGIGPIVARFWTGDDDKPLRRSISLGYLIGSVGLAIAAPLLSLPIVVFGGFVRSVGGGIAWVFSTQLLLQRAPNEIRGRIFGTEFALFTLMGGIATATVGAMLDIFGVQAVLWGMTALPLIPAVLWWLWQARHIKASQSNTIRN
ncbi:MAG: MFS transporter [Candidatus Poribacteria bacterium]|nr:MFS transporter [Candidatus Poribacteria bacterium]